MKNYAKDIDVEEVVQIFDTYVEQHVLKYLGLLDQFELIIYLNKEEFLFSFHKNKKTLFEKDLDFPFKKSILFKNTELALEVSAVFKNNSIKRFTNKTHYYTLENTKMKDPDDLDDGVIISSSVYNVDIQNYIDFKASFIANLAKSISNSKNFLCKKYSKKEITKKEDELIIIDAVLTYYKYYSMYKKTNIDVVLSSNDIYNLVDPVLSRKIKSLIKKYWGLCEFKRLLAVTRKVF